MTATAIYLRVSTKAQDTRSQEQDLRRWALAEGVDWASSVYADKFTGRSMDRPAFLRLMERVRAGDVGRLVVWRLDRLGRTARGLVELFEELQHRKVALISRREGFDLSTPAGRMMSLILASVAVYENEVKSERIVAGQAAARAEGRIWGGPVNLGKRLTVTREQEAAVVEMHGRRRKVAAIARATGLSRPTVYHVMRAHGLTPGPGPEPAEGGVP